MTSPRAAFDIRNLPDDRWGPVHEHDQSHYVEGLCERCSGWIATGERHETRSWLSGPAESCQHLVCPQDEPNPMPWWAGRRDRDQLTGAYIPGTERQDPLTGKWH